MRVDSAIIMAAGTSSRFAPLSFERPKALIEVKGETLIERQIRQLSEARIPEIFVVTGYKAEMFDYLPRKFPVKLIHNPAYLTRNNNASIRVAREVLRNSYICSADNYFPVSPFEAEVNDAYYAAEYADGPTKEWCMEEDEAGYIRAVTIGGRDAWYMMGHAFWSEEFSRRFLQILEEEYDRPETAGKFWESIYMEHLDELKMRIRRYEPGHIFEFDTLDELRAFDESYWDDTRSFYLKRAAAELGVSERALVNITALKSGSEAEGYAFDCGGAHYRCLYRDGVLRRDDKGSA